MHLSSWQPWSSIQFVTKVSVELEPLPLLFIQQEVVDVGEELLRQQRGDEALPVGSALIQQHHAEVRPGDPEGLPAEKQLCRWG